MSLSSASKPTSLIVSAFLFSAIAWLAPCAQDQIVGEHAAQVRIGGDEVGHDVEAGRGLAVRDLVGDQLQAGILGRQLFLEALVARLERSDAGQMR